MRVLGAILGGGQSSRFGSDKAAALLQGRPLMDHAIEGLRPHVETVIAVGRDWPGLLRVEDLPAPGQGPLGGLLGALIFARDKGFACVLTCGCDTVGLTADAVAALSPTPAVLDALPIVGLWSSELAEPLRDWMTDPANRSVYRFADHIGARRVAVAVPPANINRPEDLARLTKPVMLNLFQHP
ncbi:molybdenum cofactor guanylyltransferase [Chakrabartia godavariana]|nr:molybdenum cofactor guanylyltransferase [Chakrabartia godavariana]